MPSERERAYYAVHALKDGIIWLASETRKPSKLHGSRAPKIDEDGIWEWKTGMIDYQRAFVDWVKAAREAAIATTLNVKRIVRQQVECRLDAQQQQISAMAEQLKRIEEKLDRRLG